MCSRAVILAAGLGTRMRRADGKAPLTSQQTAMAEEGVKALIPIDRPFLDYSLSGIADAGYHRVCLVIGPDHDQIREHYSRCPSERLSIEFAIQPKPLGTANALIAATDFAGQDPVLVLNGDNYYPIDALRQLRETDGNALVGFDRRGLIANGNIPPDRIAAFAEIDRSDDGFLANIVEKAKAATENGQGVGAPGSPRLISMNCWRFGPAIFQACREIRPSPRGEYEIPDAVMHAICEMGEEYRVVPSTEGVLDLSSRDDIHHVAQWLSGVEVRL